MMSPDLLVVLGRVLLGGLFVVAGIKHLLLLAPVTEAIRARGVPFPRLVLLAGTVTELVAGAVLISGLYTAAAALVLAGFTLAASVLLVNFWDKQGEERALLQNVFLSNLAIIGGLLIAASHAL
jgi:putative oxidoreductase